jgi:hypothetical protein
LVVVKVSVTEGAMAKKSNKLSKRQGGTPMDVVLLNILKIVNHDRDSTDCAILDDNGEPHRSLSTRVAVSAHSMLHIFRSRPFPERAITSVVEDKIA